MAFRLTTRILTIRKGKAYLRFADEELGEGLTKARGFYERHIGCRLADFSIEEVEGCFSDRKVGGAGISVLGRFYSFRSRGLDDLLDGRETTRLSAAGIENCMDLRLRFFEFLSLNHSGFMSSESRERLLEEFSDELGLRPERLAEALWLDEEDNKVLVRLVDAPPERLHAVYNFEILATILSNSYALRVGPVRDGATVKFIFRNLRFYGLLFNLTESDEGYVFEVIGPLNIFGKASKFGYRMAILLYRLHQLSRRRPIECPFTMHFRKSRRKVSLDSAISALPDLSWPNVGDLRFHLFDSKVEAKIFSTFKTIDLGGWQVEREPEPISLAGSVFIPDFNLKRGEDEVLVEVVGFWLPEYKKRKRSKLDELHKKGIDNLLLLVDEKAKGDFESITEYPIFTYSKKGTSYRIPYSRLLGYLDARFPRETPPAAEGRKPAEPSYVERDDGRYKVFW